MTIKKYTIQEKLVQRASKLARVVDEDRSTDRSKVITQIVVAVGEQRFGLPIEHLSMIVPLPKVARLPGMPSWLQGLTQIRGDMLAVIDLIRWFQLAAGDHSGNLLTVIEHRDSHRKLGLVVDRVIGFEEVSEADIAQQFYDAAQLTGRPIQATTNRMVSIIDVERLFASPQIIINTHTRSGSR